MPMSLAVLMVALPLGWAATARMRSRWGRGLAVMTLAVFLAVPVMAYEMAPRLADHPPGWRPSDLQLELLHFAQELLDALFMLAGMLGLPAAVALEMQARGAGLGARAAWGGAHDADGDGE